MTNKFSLFYFCYFTFDIEYFLRKLLQFMAWIIYRQTSEKLLRFISLSAYCIYLWNTGF